MNEYIGDRYPVNSAHAVIGLKMGHCDPWWCDQGLGNLASPIPQLASPVWAGVCQQLRLPEVCKADLWPFRLCHLALLPSR